MKVNGKLRVKDAVDNSPFTIYDSTQSLFDDLTSVGAIGYYDDFLYYRDSITVRKLVNVTTLSEELSTLIIGGDVINNISTELLTDNTFLTNLSESVEFINRLANSEQFVDTVEQVIANALNVEVKNLQGDTLFFAFSPEEILVSSPPVINEEDVPDPEEPISVTPTSINILGNMSPLRGTTETYTLDIEGGSNYITTFTVTGGTIIGNSVNVTSVQVVWDTDYVGLASINAGAGKEDAVFDFNFFVLGEVIIEEELVGKLQILSYSNISKQQAFTNFFNDFTDSFYTLKAGMQTETNLYEDITLDTLATDGFYCKISTIYTVESGKIIETSRHAF